MIVVFILLFILSLSVGQTSKLIQNSLKSSEPNTLIPNLDDVRDHKKTQSFSSVLMKLIFGSNADKYNLEKVISRRQESEAHFKEADSHKNKNTANSSTPYMQTPNETRIADDVSKYGFYFGDNILEPLYRNYIAEHGIDILRREGKRICDRKFAIATFACHGGVGNRSKILSCNGTLRIHMFMTYIYCILESTNI